ncbi:hypothetical protein BTVI_99548 [Pitangus sulphuratus]|nr:hypothetical protein BTVI_99548 [Pitangus sulphuratus]
MTSPLAPAHLNTHNDITSQTSMKSHPQDGGTHDSSGSKACNINQDGATLLQRPTPSALSLLATQANALTDNSHSLTMVPWPTPPARVEHNLTASYSSEDAFANSHEVKPFPERNQSLTAPCTTTVTKKLFRPVAVGSKGDYEEMETAFQEWKASEEQGVSFKDWRNHLMKIEECHPSG